MTNRLLTPSFLMNLVVALLLIAALIEIQEFASSARFVPSLFAWLTLALVAIDLVRQVATVTLESESRAPNDNAPVIEDSMASDRTQLLHVILYVLAFWGAVFFMGFYGLPVFLVGAYLVFEAKVRWLIAIPAALIGNITIVWAMKGVGVKVWTGALPTIVPGFIGGENWPVF